ncbi:MAG: hypothetical protein KDC35_15025 [Acidobacteria bacterium]|nr:hypothetical protein [Acidobacteriota bacterium]
MKSHSFSSLTPSADVEPIRVALKESATRFDKIHACGNDFILIQDSFDHQNVSRWCHRQLGIGADGVMAVSHCAESNVGLLHYDADGSRTFCLNGTRSALWALYQQGLIDKSGTVSSEGVTASFHVDEWVVLVMSNPPTTRMQLSLDHVTFDGFFVEPGNPQFVLIDPPESWCAHAKDLRHHRDFHKGANVTYVFSTPMGYRIRTFERGVEGFTLACGTGALAAAAAMNARSARFVPDGGDWIEVARDGAYAKVTGPTHWVATGWLS